MREVLQREDQKVQRPGNSKNFSPTVGRDVIEGPCRQTYPFCGTVIEQRFKRHLNNTQKIHLLNQRHLANGWETAGTLRDLQYQWCWQTLLFNYPSTQIAWVEAQSMYFSCLGPPQLGPAAAPGKWHPRPSLESSAPSHFSQDLLQPQPAHPLGTLRAACLGPPCQCPLQPWLSLLTRAPRDQYVPASAPAACQNHLEHAIYTEVTSIQVHSFGIRRHSCVVKFIERNTERQKREKAKERVPNEGMRNKTKQGCPK